jgi:hypothetical protein
MGAIQDLRFGSEVLKKRVIPLESRLSSAVEQPICNR